MTLCSHEPGMTDRAKPLSRPWRRFLRFSVRGLIVLVLVLGGWLGWIVRNARIQREAVAVIRKMGGSFTYDWAWRDGETAAGIRNANGTLLYDWEWYFGEEIPAGKPWAPKRLVDFVGVDYFGNVAEDGLNHKVNLETVVQIGRLTRLQ